MPMKTEQKTWLENSKAITQDQSFHYRQLIQALAPTIMSLFPYELIPIESETQIPITVTDMSQSGTLPPAPGMEHVEPEQAPPSPAPPANPIPLITVNATQKEVKMNMLTPFTGDRKKLEEFLIKTDMYLTMNEDTYNNNSQQIIFALSFMKDGIAGSWKQSFWTQARENNNLRTWDQFKRALRESFSAPNKEGDAVTKMETEMMSSQMTDEYIKWFKIYMAESVMEQPLVLSHLILSILPLLSYQINYPTLIWFQFDCYGTALYLIFYILSLFGLVDIIIWFDSCLVLLHTADSMPCHYFILLTFKPYPYSAKLYSYSAISLYVLSFTPYLLIFLSSYLWLIW